MTSKHLPYDPTAEKFVPVIHHAFTATAKMKHIFVAPREAGHWRLWHSFDARENVLGEMERAKAQGYLVEIVVTDDDAASVAKMLHKRAAAFHRAGLGPDRTPPLPARPPARPPVTPAVQAVSGLAPVTKRVRVRPSRKKSILELPSKETPATSGPSLPEPTAEVA